MKQMKLLQNDAGMTLVEVMIAGGVSATAFVLVLGSVFNVADTASASGSRTAALSHVSSVLEELSHATEDELFAYEAPALPGLGAGSHVQVACLLPGGEQITLPLGEGALEPVLPNPVELRVTVVYRDHLGRLRSTSGASLFGS